MKNFKSIFLIMAVLVSLNSYCQNDTTIKNGYVNVATLIVDYDTYNFDGGAISYYSCPICAIDSIPFAIDYDSPGDFGGVTFKLSSLQDTVFNATIIWMGTGQIYKPTEFSKQAPFTNSNVATGKSDDLRYINTDGSAITDTSLLIKADSAWNAICSLEITNLFAEKGLKSAIYLYPPTVGCFDPNVAKWIVFLYHNDKSNEINLNYNKSLLLQLFPNPANGKVEIYLNLKNSDKTNYKIFNTSGQLVESGDFFGNVHQLDVSIINSGSYFLYLSDKNGKIIATEKVIF